MSSKRRLRRKACTGKQPFPNHHAANYVAAKLREQGTQVNSYKCKFCRCWHVGHRPREVEHGIDSRAMERQEQRILKQRTY